MSFNNKEQIVIKEGINSAIGSWSGFLFQGWNALYHVFNLLTKDNQDNSNKYRYFELTLDCQEDFAIMFGDHVISLHQCKATNPDYKEAFDELKARKEDFGGNSYFHTAIRSNKYCDHNNGNIINLEGFKDLEFYKYDDGKYYCQVYNIVEKLQSKISSFLQLSGYTHNNVKSIQAELIHMIEKCVLRAHHENIHGDMKVWNSANKNRIKFSEIIEVCKNPSYKELSVENRISLLRMELVRYKDLFISEREEDEGISEDNISKIDSYIESICRLDDKSFFAYARKISPHQGFNGDISQFLINSFDKGVKESFLLILHSLNKSNTLNNPEWVYQDKLYRPTSISAGNLEEYSVCKDIINNADANSLNDTDFYIASGMSIQSIKDRMNRIKDINVKEKSNHIFEKRDVGIRALHEIPYLHDNEPN